MLEKLVLDFFLKKTKFSIYLDQQSEIWNCLFLLYA